MQCGVGVQNNELNVDDKFITGSGKHSDWIYALILTFNIHFRLTNGWSCESVEFFCYSRLEPWRLQPPTFEFMPNALTISATRATYLLFNVLECWLWRYRYFCLQSQHMKCQLCTGNKIHIRLANGCPWESLDVSETENILNPQHSNSHRMLYQLTYLLCNDLEYWLWRYRCFCLLTTVHE